MTPALPVTEAVGGTAAQMKWCAGWVTRLAALLLVFVDASAGYGQGLSREIGVLAGQISESLRQQGFTSVAATDFTDLQGHPTELGRFLSDQLTVEIVSAGGVQMVDRANIKRILDEHQLTEQGLVDPANAKRLGEFAGVDALLIGNVTALDDEIVLTVKAIATGSARLVAAGRASMARTPEMQQLLNRSVVADTPARPVPMMAPSAPSGAASGATNVLGSVDIGNLRVVLRSVAPVVATGPSGTPWVSIRATLDLVNLDLATALAVALNSQEGTSTAMAEGTRTSAVDEKGRFWRVGALGVSGLGVVGAGTDGGRPYNPTQIGALLSRENQIGTNRNPGNPLLGPFDTPSYFVHGTPTVLEAGQTARVVMVFTPEMTGPVHEPPAMLDLSIEIVVGEIVGPRGFPFSLRSVAFDQVSVKPSVR